MQARDVTDKLKTIAKRSLRASFNEAKREYKALEKVHGDEACQNGLLSAGFAVVSAVAAIGAIANPVSTAALALTGTAFGIGWASRKFAQQAVRESEYFKKNGPRPSERPPF